MAEQEIPHFEVTEEHRSLAEKLTSTFATFLTQERPDRRESADYLARAIIRTETDVPLQDVSNQVQRFAQILSFSREYGLPIPMALIPEVGWIPIFGDFPAHVLEYFAPIPRRLSESWLSVSVQRAWPFANGVSTSPPEIAQKYFVEALRQFLNYRVAGHAFWQVNFGLSGGASGGGQSPPGPPPSSPFAPNGGIIVTLSCTNSHLRALASPVLGINWHQFGSPTTPVTGILQPGLWLFAADGGIFGTSIQVDLIPARIPPLLKPCATAF